METILIVDDEAPIRSLVARLVRHMGHACVEAEDVDAALAQVDLAAPSVAITDLKMPGKTGLDLAAALRESHPHCPVILMTAYADLESARQAISVGVYEYFKKPFDVNDLSAGIARAITFRRLQLENESYKEDLEKKIEVRTRELNRAFSDLIQSEKLSAVGRLSAGIVHEVLNPLSVVAGRIDMVLMGKVDESVTRSLMLAREQVHCAVRIMDNLRRFSKPREPARGAVDLYDLVSRTVELVGHLARRNGIEVSVGIEDLPTVEADQEQIAQVFLNLINNAIDAMPDGGCLRVDGQALPDTVTVEVSDTGTGIPEDKLESVFEPFFTTKGEAGTGLGLPICRGIAEAHGGTLTAHVNPGPGTTFVLRLPVAAAVIPDLVRDPVRNTQTEGVTP